MALKRACPVPLQTGVIDIGAHAVRLDIYELNRAWKSERLETLSRPLALGTDVFRNGFVSVSNLKALLEIVETFRNKLREYGANEYQVIATSALREAFNRELIVDRLRDAGVELKILDAPTEATLTYLAAKDVIAGGDEAAFARSVMLILGSGSLFVIGIAGGLMRFCEEIPTGFLRVNDNSSESLSAVDQLLASLNSQRILQRLNDFMPERKKDELTLIIIGNSARKLAALAGEKLNRENECAVFPAKEFCKVLQNCRNGSKKYFRKLDESGIVEVTAASVIVGFFFENLKCSSVVCPGITTRGALLQDWIRRCREPEQEPFRPDLAAVCSAIGKRYDFDFQHARRVAIYSASLFGKLRHYFSFPEHSGLMLEAASYLHDIGRFVDARKHQHHSWYLISNTQLPGLSDSEHRVVAAVSRYHGKSIPRENHPEYAMLSADEKVSVLKLASILRVADALDNRNDGAAMEIKPVLRNRILNILTDLELPNSQKFALKNKSGLFEQVFGLELKLLENEL